MSELAFRSKGWWGYSEEFMAACRDELTVDPGEIDDPGSLFYVAQTGGEIAGFFSLVDPLEGTVELGALFVDPSWIGTGIGRALIEHAGETARQLGYSALLIQGDPHAAGFYRAAGGVSAGERESDSIPGRLLPLFRISLHNPVEGTRDPETVNPSAAAGSRQDLD